MKSKTARRKYIQTMSRSILYRGKKRANFSIVERAERAMRGGEELDSN